MTPLSDAARAWLAAQPFMQPKSVHELALQKYEDAKRGKETLAPEEAALIPKVVKKRYLPCVKPARQSVEVSTAYRETVIRSEPRMAGWGSLGHGKRRRV